MLITQKHLNVIHHRLTSKTQRNPTLYAKRFGSISGDCWVSLYISARVGAWAADVLFLKHWSLGIIRSTPTNATRAFGVDSLRRTTALTSVSGNQKK